MNKNIKARRILKELKEINDNPQDSYKIIIKDEKCYNLEAILYGPKDTPYESGTFHLDISFPDDYPFKPPKVIFKTPIYHCNINKKGHICLDILKSQWSPALTLSKVLLSVSSLLSDPNPNDPLVPEIANLYKKNKNKHDDNVRKNILDNKNLIY